MSLTELLARVEAATGRLADEDLSRLICAVRGWKLDSYRIATGDDGSDELVINADGRYAMWSAYRWCCPDCSVDAALELVERTLLGWEFDIQKAMGIAFASVYPPQPFPPSAESSAKRQDGSVPMALVAACLRALIAKAAP